MHLSSALRPESCRLSATKSISATASPKVRCCWMGHGYTASSTKAGIGSGLSPKPWNETKAVGEKSLMEVVPTVVGDGSTYIGSSGLISLMETVTFASISMAVIDTSPSPCAPCTSPMPTPQPSTKHSSTRVLPTARRCESWLP
eukprot:scaffold24837_cov105-Isochrysis_galbana.AAC.2